MRRGLAQPAISSGAVLQHRIPLDEAAMCHETDGDTGLQGRIKLIKAAGPPPAGAVESIDLIVAGLTALNLILATSRTDNRIVRVARPSNDKRSRWNRDCGSWEGNSWTVAELRGGDGRL